MQAARSGMTEVCQLYLEHGADVNASSEVCLGWDSLLIVTLFSVTKEL